MMKLLHLGVVLAAIADDESLVDTVQGARELANAAGARLHVLHVAPGTEPKTVMTPLLERAGVAPSSVTVHALDGDPALVIRSLADRIRADVIVLGRHRGRVAEVPGIGSTALAVVTNSWAPCLIVSARLRLPLERVLVPLDLSDTSRGALVVALSWASALRGADHRKGGAGGAGEAGGASDAGVALTALVVRAPGVSQDEHTLDEALRRLRADAGTWAHVGIDAAVLSSRDVTAAIADYAREQRSDLIVLGTRGLGSGAVGRLGSVSLGVAERVTTPVLLVPPAVWTTYAADAHGA